jgi:hypothetical protein
LPWLIAGLMVVVVAAGGTALLLRPVSPPVAPPAIAPQPAAPAVPAAPPATVAPLAAAPPAAPPLAAAPAPAAPPSPAFALSRADEVAIFGDAATQLTIFQFAQDPAVVVLDFPSLGQQGRMLNRIAALVEKAGLPRDRVLTDAELDAAIRSHGDTEATYYYGHDYSAATLAHFFALADRDHVLLNASEEMLRGLLRQLGWFEPDPHGALISLSREGADPDITPWARAAILHHELSHGVFFAEPLYADFVRRFWQTALTEAERSAVRKFLGSEDYDTGDDDLMANEMQAYLMFTGDPHFFLPSNIGMTAERRAALQAEFRRDEPIAWLRSAILGPADAPRAPAPQAPVPQAAVPQAAVPQAAAAQTTTSQTAPTQRSRAISPSAPLAPATARH